MLNLIIEGDELFDDEIVLEHGLEEVDAESEGGGSDEQQQSEIDVDADAEAEDETAASRDNGNDADDFWKNNKSSG